MILTLIAQSFGGYSVSHPRGFSFGGFTIAAILSKLVLKYIFPLAGLILLFFLINGGFDLLTSTGDPKKIEAGKEKITAAIVGFTILFVAYWLYKIIIYILTKQT